MKGIRFILLTFLVVFSFASCGIDFSGIVVLRGNYFYNRGNYNRALIDYYGILDRSKDSNTWDNGKYKKYILYNIGTVYLANGEFKSAISKLESASKCNNEKNAELCFRSNFNLGYIYYQLGDYNRAVTYFINSLLVKPSSLDAKKNLELALRKLHLNSTIGMGNREERKKVSKSMAGAALRLLDYVKGKEENLWRETIGGQSYLEEPNW